MKPVILISGTEENRANNERAIAAAGGIPRFFRCPAPDFTCAGLLLTGGGDPDPALYGQTPRGANPPDRERDAAERALIYAFLAAGKPIFGLCRGMQMLAAALGGTLIQDLGAACGVFHRPLADGADNFHPVRAQAGSVLFRLYGPHFFVNSAHHQAVALPGDGFCVTVRSEGGTAEAMEHRTRAAFAVQFHPERALRVPGAADGAALFRHFISLCEGGAADAP